MKTFEEVYAVAEALDRMDLTVDARWGVDDGEVWCSFNCNDLFDWATADSQDIEPHHLPLLNRCYDALLATGDPVNTCHTDLLFASAIRRRLPLAVHLDRMSQPVADLIRQAADGELQVVAIDESEVGDGAT